MKKISYQIDRRQQIPLYLQIYQQIRQGINRQELRLGDKLPSKRQLCEYLQVSQNTVESAYAQLLAEGYIESQARKGFFVCYQAEYPIAVEKPRSQPDANLATHSVEFDFNPNHIYCQNFPFRAWQKSARLGIQQQQQLLSLGEKQGERALRIEIAQYLAASRGIQCEIEQIVICAGVENAMQQLILLFNHLYPQTHFTYAMESYGYSTIEKLLKLYDKNLVKLPFHQDKLDLNVLFQSQVNVAYLTPSHLFPFGQVLSIGQRQRLLEWANSAPDRYILEDDYDSEFRYQGRPIPALQSLDSQNKVIYFGSFSKLLMPSLRIGFMVLPPALLQAYQQHCGFFNCAVARLEQQRLAHFIQQGEFEKHIHRMRKIYRHKMALLCELFAPYKQKIVYYGAHSGLYLLVELFNDSRSSEEICHQAYQQHIQLYPVAVSQRLLFSIGFAHLEDDELKIGIQRLLGIFLA
ncbi:MAG: PLP-dependent aminotransferase family protein [Pasteurellaceae bacterium]|nr:PLP-dependent aminotransferase family protein [Pasteurellaceae bacterium]